MPLLTFPCKYPQEAIDFEGNSKQQCLTGLGGDRSADCAEGEFALHGGEDTFDQTESAVLRAGKIRTHVVTDTGGSPAGEAFCNFTRPISAITNCEESIAAST
jgi:hypothetical protein